MKKIGFLSFGHWTPSPQSQTRSAADTLLQSIELAVAAEQLGADGASSRASRRTAWPALVPSSPQGSGWPDGALRSIKVRACHLGQTGRVAEQPVSGC